MGFYLDTLEDELLSLLTSVSPSPNSQSLNHAEVREEEAPKEAGWMEVGRKNRIVITRTVWVYSPVVGSPNLSGRLKPPTPLSLVFLGVLSVRHSAYRSTRIP